MNEYMIVVRFIASSSEEFINLIPEHRKLVNELMEKGIISGYSLSSDRRILWITMLASSKEAAEKTLQLTPLYDYMRFEIYDLMFHLNPSYSPMRFSMN